jgi:DNA repair exonuclease SbcCD ATPase subunit
MLKRMTVS